MASQYTDPAAEVQQLQQELYKMRQKEMQQEHNIHVLTAQLKSRQLIPAQGILSASSPNSSVAAKWQEWHQKRSLSPEPFNRQIAAGTCSQGPARPGSMSPDRSRTITAAKSPPAADSHTKRITTSPDLLPQTSLHWSSLNSCSFGSERRWYQPGQAADRAAALQQQALAAAAAERQVIDASQLLTAAPRSHSVTHQHSTFGSEPRFWEERSSLGTYVAQPEGQTSSSRQASPTQRRQQSPKGRHHHHSSHGVPQQSAGTSKKRYTFGLAPRWYEYSDQSSARQAHTTSPAPAPAQSATRDRVASVPPKAYSQPRSDVCASVQSNNSRRSISAGRSNAHQAGMPSSERSWWLSDSAAASNAVLRRIQEKHAHIQQLAAMISQQKSDSGQQHKRGRCHTVKAPSKPTHVLQSQAEPSPAQGFAPEPSMQSMLSVHASLPGQPVGGSSLQQPAHLLTPGHAPSAIMPSSDLLSEVAQDSQSGGSDQAELSAAIRQQQSLSRLPKDQPAHVSSLGDYVTTSSIMHSRSDASVPLHLPNDGSPGVAPQDMNPTASSTWPRGEHDTFGSPSAKTTLGRSQTFNSSRSVSPTWRRTASISDRSGLQEDLRNRSAERTRLHQMVAPHPRDWEQNLRDSCHFKRSNSIKESREMQEDFVQKAESQLEVFHQTTHSFSDTASQSDLNATQTSSQGPAYSLKQLQQKAPAPTTRHLRQILRTGSKSARQEPEKGVTQRQRQGRSSSISGTRMAVLQQQQEQVAQAAEQKLAAFQAAKEQRQARSTKAPGGRTARSARLAIKGQPTASKLLPHQGAPKPTKPIVRKLQSVLSTSHAQQQQAVRRASSGISWAAELQLREPEDEDIGHHLDFDSQALREYTAQGMTPDVAAQELQSEQQWPAVLAEQPVEARMQTPELQRERLNAYYRQKAAAEQAAYFDAKLYAEQVQQQNIQQQQPGAPGTIGALSMHAEPSVKAGMAAVSADSVFGRLREVKAMASSLQLPSYGSVNLKQSELEKLSPGLPGLQSQLSKMMQEVSQARTEVLGLRSELGQSTLLGQKSGSTSSVAPDAGH